MQSCLLAVLKFLGTSFHMDYLIFVHFIQFIRHYSWVPFELDTAQGCKQPINEGGVEAEEVVLMEG